MFRGVFSAAERVGAGPMVRLTSRVLTYASRFWQIESLYRSNARYLPRWTPRYLCYDSSLTLTRVALPPAWPRDSCRTWAVRASGSATTPSSSTGGGCRSPRRCRAAEPPAKRCPTGRPAQPAADRSGSTSLPGSSARAAAGYPVGVPRRTRSPIVVGQVLPGCRPTPHRPAGLGGRPGPGAARLRWADLRGAAGWRRPVQAMAEHRVLGRRRASAVPRDAWTSATSSASPARC